MAVDASSNSSSSLDSPASEPTSVDIPIRSLPQSFNALLQTENILPVESSPAVTEAAEAALNEKSTNFLLPLASEPSAGGDNIDKTDGLTEWPFLVPEAASLPAKARGLKNKFFATKMVRKLQVGKVGKSLQEAQGKVKSLKARNKALIAAKRASRRQASEKIAELEKQILKNIALMGGQKENLEVYRKEKEETRCRRGTAKQDVVELQIGMGQARHTIAQLGVYQEKDAENINDRSKKLEQPLHPAGAIEEPCNETETKHSHDQSGVDENEPVAVAGPIEKTNDSKKDPNDIKALYESSVKFGAFISTKEAASANQANEATHDRTAINNATYIEVAEDYDNTFHDSSANPSVVPGESHTTIESTPLVFVAKYKKISKDSESTLSADSVPPTQIDVPSAASVLMQNSKSSMLPPKYEQKSVTSQEIAKLISKDHAEPAKFDFGNSTTSPGQSRAFTAGSKIPETAVKREQNAKGNQRGITSGAQARKAFTTKTKSILGLDATNTLQQCCGLFETDSNSSKAQTRPEQKFGQPIVEGPIFGPAAVSRGSLNTVQEVLQSTQPAVESSKTPPTTSTSATEPAAPLDSSSGYSSSSETTKVNTPPESNSPLSATSTAKTNETSIKTGEQALKAPLVERNAAAPIKAEQGHEALPETKLALRTIGGGASSITNKEAASSGLKCHAVGTLTAPPDLSTGGSSSSQPPEPPAAQAVKITHRTNFFGINSSFGKRKIPKSKTNSEASNLKAKISHTASVIEVKSPSLPSSASTTHRKDHPQTAFTKNAPPPAADRGLETPSETSSQSKIEHSTPGLADALMRLASGHSETSPDSPDTRLLDDVLTEDDLFAQRFARLSMGPPASDAHRSSDGGRVPELSGAWNCNGRMGHAMREAQTHTTFSPGTLPELPLPRWFSEGHGHQWGLTLQASFKPGWVVEELMRLSRETSSLSQSGQLRKSTKIASNTSIRKPLSGASLKLSLVGTFSRLSQPRVAKAQQPKEKATELKRIANIFLQSTSKPPIKFDDFDGDWQSLIGLQPDQVTAQAPHATPAHAPAIQPKSDIAKGKGPSGESQVLDDEGKALLDDAANAPLPPGFDDDNEDDEEVASVPHSNQQPTMAPPATQAQAFVEDTEDMGMLDAPPVAPQQLTLQVQPVQATQTLEQDMMVEDQEPTKVSDSEFYAETEADMSGTELEDEMW